ncbi:MAG: UDP-2,3-diacylglucosamine diphosphatase [candidate division Zixibacteria bacterium]|nr:UDP-2,3-diacylglucosamine diphosphatase [candidate division Zixibacteria bacterium]
MPDPVYFLSDVHLGADTLEKEQYKRDRLLAFLRHLQGQTPLLYIVGDLFDFWFEYQSAILKQHFGVLRALSELVERGTRVVYIAGNHDFWLGDFLREQIGVETVYGPLTVEHQGRRLFVCHGDGMIGRDWRYRFMKRILHNRTSIWLFQLVHPDMGVALGRLVSRLSRRHGGPLRWDPKQAYRTLALDMLEKQRYDAIVLGHVHSPDLYRQDEKTYLNLGDWVCHFTFGRLSDGRLELRRFTETLAEEVVSSVGEQVVTPSGKE